MASNPIQKSKFSFSPSINSQLGSAYFLGSKLTTKATRQKYKNQYKPVQGGMSPHIDHQRHQQLGIELENSFYNKDDSVTQSPSVIRSRARQEAKAYKELEKIAGKPKLYYE